MLLSRAQPQETGIRAKNKKSICAHRHSETMCIRVAPRAVQAFLTWSVAAASVVSAPGAALVSVLACGFATSGFAASGFFAAGFALRW